MAHEEMTRENDAAADWGERTLPPVVRELAHDHGEAFPPEIVDAACRTAARLGERLRDAAASLPFDTEPGDYRRVLESAAIGEFDDVG
jgi:hypothetical protein